MKADLATVTLAQHTLDAVTAFYSLTHVPRIEHAKVFGRIANWLEPGGYLLFDSGRAWRVRGGGRRLRRRTDVLQRLRPAWLSPPAG